MPKERDGDDERENNAPVTPAAADRTERHLVKARELLREARSRLTARDDGAAGAGADPEPPSNDSEEP